MIFVKNTPSNAGVAIFGDHKDFEALYESLHNVVGDEDEFLAHNNARLRVLGVCYDLRHALMGDRDLEFVENGIDADMIRSLKTITPDKNVYLKINVLWPEMLFVAMALNDFVRLYAWKKAKKGYNLVLDWHNIWDESIAYVRVFQAAIATCLREIVSQANFSRMMNLMTKSYTWLEDYADQYVDMLNCRYLEMSKEKRLKSISTMARKLTDMDDEYKRVKNAVLAAAKKYNCPVENIELKKDYPVDIEW